MDTLFNKEQFEKFFLLNWNNFLERKEIKKIIKQLLQEDNNFLVEINYNNKPPYQSISLSRFEWNLKGFIIWIEFIDCNKQITKGTIEILIEPNKYTILNYI